jgi:hypothetical protein
MKINEVVQEGVWDTLKKVGAGTAGAVRGASAGKGVRGTVGNAIQGAKAGAAASAAASTQQDLINRVTTKAVADWSKFAQNKQASEVPATAADAQQWFKNYTGGVATPTTAPAGLSPAQMQQWLSKEVASYMANKAAGTAAAPGPADAEDQPAQAQTTVGQAETVQTVVTPTGQTALKKSDGKWYREDGTPVDNPTDIKQLNQMVISARETARAKGNPMPKVITAQTQQAANTAAQTATTTASGIQATVEKDGQYLYKKSDNNWYREDGTKVADGEIPELDQLWMDARAKARAKGQERDAATTDATAQQSAGTQQSAPTTATNGDIFAGDTQQPEAQLPDVSQLTAAERAELRKQLQA